MSVFWELAAFAGVLALAQFSPGPDMVLLTRTALAEGAAAGTRMALGIATGLMVHAALAVSGWGLAFEAGGWWVKALAWAGAVYLGWLAVQLGRQAWRKQGAIEAAALGKAGSAYRRGLLCNLLNPKALLFGIVLIAPFVAGDRPPWWPWALWGIVVIQGGVLWTLWARALQWKPVRVAYGRAARGIDAVFAVVLAGLALKLGFFGL